MLKSFVRPHLRRPTLTFAFTLLAIEFLDEFVCSGREAAWPLIRTDLGLNFAQIGLLMSMPGIVSCLLEPFLGILGDVWRRRVLVLAGGICFTLSMLLTATSHSFVAMMAAYVLFSPSSGAFVGLSQATLMDLDRTRHEHNMARWALAGSIGMVTGPLALTGILMMGLGWRSTFFIFGLIALVALITVSLFRFPSGPGQPESPRLTIRQGFINAARALKRGEVLRWLTLLQFSNLMLDILLGFLALYFVDVVKVTPAQAGLAVAIWTGVGLAGDFLLIPLLERVRGLTYLRASAAIVLVLFPTFLVVPGMWPKYVLLGLLGFFNSGWYSILKGQLYSAMPGQSGTVMTVGNIFGLIGSLIPLGLGLVAQHWGLSVTMWLLVAGPVALLTGIPRRQVNAA